MQRNPFWILFMGLIILGVLGYSTYTMIKVWHYVRFNQETVADKIQWTIIEVNEESFVPFAHYSFRVEGQPYDGQTRWADSYLNQWTAQEAIARLEKHPPSVWFNSSDPTISSLQKIFPIKESLYSLILWILGIYFLGLGYYVNRRFL